jgi:excisionase family DNA binding protein
MLLGVLCFHRFGEYPMNHLLDDVNDLDALLTRAEVAALLSVAPSTVTRWADEGKLPCVRTLGGHRRYQKDEIVRIMQSIQRETEQGLCTTEEAGMEEFEVEVPGLYGDHHATAVQQALAHVAGIVQVWASPAHHLVRVTFDPEQIAADAIVHRLARAGYLTRNGHAETVDHHKDPAWSALNLRMTQTYRSDA